jgi:CRISPR system Cascade subunit CasE
LLRKLPSLGFTIPEIKPALHAPGIERNTVSAEHTAVLAAPKIHDVVITSREHLNFTKSATHTGPRVSLVTATYEGRLRVTDVDVLRERLLGGVGPAKAYGCGLLTLAPLSAERDA